MKNVFYFYAACLLISMGILTSCAPEVSAIANEAVDVMQAPRQRSTQKQKFSLQRGDYKFAITPVAEYIINAEVKSTRRYSSDWQALISPVDFALAWQGLTEEKARPHITYSQSNRWYYYRYDGQSPYKKKYIAEHSSNHHILPATENIEKAALAIDKGDHVRIKGLLVNVDGRDSSGKKVWWRSSLSRTDQGDGACEVFWITELQRGENIYR